MCMSESFSCATADSVTATLEAADDGSVIMSYQRASGLLWGFSHQNDALALASWPAQVQTVLSTPHDMLDFNARVTEALITT